jgi:hypothetical protein
VDVLVKKLAQVREEAAGRFQAVGGGHELQGDPLTPTTSRTWGPLPAPAGESAGCGPPSPPRGRGK